MKVNAKRVWLGALGGWLVWAFWDAFCGFVVIGQGRYDAAQAAGTFLKVPRYPAFPLQWEIYIFLCAVVCAWAYAWSRRTMGPGMGSALKLGAMLGFLAGFPLNFAQAAWTTGDRMMPTGWLLDFWGGCMLATVVAGCVYRDE